MTKCFDFSFNFESCCLFVVAAVSLIFCLFLGTVCGCLVNVSPFLNAVDDKTCDVKVVVGAEEAAAETQFGYQAGLTMTVTGVAPLHGGSGGGTRVTVSGTKFECASGSR